MSATRPTCYARFVRFVLVTPIPGRGYAAITDQYLLGRAILVAPVLEKGATRRTVEFPPGVWQGDDGSVVAGPCRVEVTAPMNRLPWYRKG